MFTDAKGESNSYFRVVKDYFSSLTTVKADHGSLTTSLVRHLVYCRLRTVVRAVSRAKKTTSAVTKLGEQFAVHSFKSSQTGQVFDSLTAVLVFR